MNVQLYIIISTVFMSIHSFAVSQWLLSVLLEFSVYY